MKTYSVDTRQGPSIIMTGIPRIVIRPTSQIDLPIFLRRQSYMGYLPLNRRQTTILVPYFYLSPLIDFLPGSQHHNQPYTRQLQLFQLVSVFCNNGTDGHRVLLFQAWMAVSRGEGTGRGRRCA